jgi:uncharacterized membrane protein YsdA (DUF1294 family)
MNGWILLIYLAVINCTAFVLYGIDKHRAEKNRWRIRERTLLGAAFLGGGIGALAGMKVFHHKTLHASFRFGVPCALILWLVLLGWLYGEGYIVF